MGKTGEKYKKLKGIPANERYIGWVVFIDDYCGIVKEKQKWKITGYKECDCLYSEGCVGRPIFEESEYGNDCMSFSQIRCYAKWGEKQEQEQLKRNFRMIRIEE